MNFDKGIKMKTGYNNFISFKSRGTCGDLIIIRDLKEIGDIIVMGERSFMVEIPSMKISDKSFPTLGLAKSFVFNTLNPKKK